MPLRQVRDPHGGVGRVDRLAARARRAVDVDLQVLVVDRDLDLLGLGHHGDGRRRGVDPALRLGRGHALDAVRAALALEDGERAVALHREDASP